MQIFTKAGRNSKEGNVQDLQEIQPKHHDRSKQKIVNFLDISLDLENDIYMPYHKANNNATYMNINSNHPPGKSGLKSNLQFEKKEKENDQKANNVKPKRKRKITWYNPPLSGSVKTNVGKTFLKLINKHFPKTSNLYKIINKNTIKVSYSCLPNLKQAIINHNKRLIKQEKEENAPPPKSCNCRKKEDCPLKGDCLTNSVIYKATVTQIKTGTQDSYIGLTENSFKTRVVSASDSRSGGRRFDSRPCHVAIALGKQFTLSFLSPPTCKMGTQLQEFPEFVMCAYNTLHMGLKVAF
ncbi:hypothetical protein ElyMa_004864100 [Elysia marginata]|uniref:Uncharacterized protein n=1 Tax=Elysia marginata TaxID=1093978 RepID=A0AAV4IR11_9GAST|nr:hypothetical protein ElyMa_004864100 [Elysia marginata]